MVNLKLIKFDMSKIKDDSVIVFIGRRNTGKSFLVKDCLYHHRDMPIGTIISGTEKESGYYGKFNPSLFIHYEFTSELVANVNKRQSIVIDEQKKEIKNRIPYDFDWKDRMKDGERNSDILYELQRKDCWISRQEYQMSLDKIRDVKDERDNQYYVSWNGEKVSANIDARSFLLLDDCLYDNTWVKDTNIRSFFLNGRHKDLLLIITMQYVMGIPPLLRTNIDYVFILREPYVQNRRRIFENFAGVFPTFEVFCQVMDQCTENYECLVIHTNSKSNKLEDQVFWYKAEKHDEFRIGADEYWKYHNENFEETTDENNEDIISATNNKKKGPKVHVKRV
jgi:hypothetical protein